MSNNTSSKMIHTAVEGSLYRDLSLKPGQIRILQLLPGRWLENICCQLTNAALNENPNYQALSYVWGYPEDTVSLTVNKLNFQATRNLVAALRRLRSSIKPQTLWVDALCINQNDLDEKTQQILIMDKIYKGASSVQVFLGESGVLDAISLEEQAMWDDPPRFGWHRDSTFIIPTEVRPSRAVGSAIGTDNNSEPFALIFGDTSEYEPIDPKESPMWLVWNPQSGIKDQSRVDSFFSRQRDPLYKAEDRSAIQRLRDSQADAFAIMNVLSNGRCLKSCLQADSTSLIWTQALGAINHLSKLQWWSRIWVLQEAILPRNDVIAIYGEIRAPMELIEDSGSVLPRHYEKGKCCEAFWHSLPASQRAILDRFAKLMTPLEALRELHHLIQEDQLAMLIKYIKLTRYREATDPRDKIFGLLGLISDCPNPVDIIPDYKQTEAQVYTNVALRIINHDRCLNSILAVCENKVSGTALPTWVPQWTRPIGISDVSATLRMGMFMAWPPAPEPPPKLIDDYVLAVRGMTVDRIEEVTKSLFRDEADLPSTIDELEIFFGLTDEPCAMYKGECTLFDAFWLTAIGGLLYHVDRQGMMGETIKFDRAHEADIQMLYIAKRAWSNNLDNVHILGPDGDLLLDEDIAHISQFARESFWYANEGRLFFKTANGYIGSGPVGTRVDDEVVLVHGSTVPLIMRSTDVPSIPSVLNSSLPLDGHWFQFVGCAYVHGIMDGEAAPGQDRTSIQEQVARMGKLYSIDLHWAGIQLVEGKTADQMFLV